MPAIELKSYEIGKGRIFFGDTKMRKKKAVTPRIRGTKKEGAEMIRALLKASLHNEYSHDFESHAKKCERCKLHKRAEKLAAKLEEAQD